MEGVCIIPLLDGRGFRVAQQHQRDRARVIAIAVGGVIVLWMRSEIDTISPAVGSAPADIVVIMAMERAVGWFSTLPGTCPGLRTTDRRTSGPPQP